jgi:peptidoglycan/LPS O-acetylase OafA/YrhL
MNPDKEIKSLTGLRGIAALYVVMFHFFIGQHFTNPFTTLLAHGYLAVDVFFVLSGFVMTLTYSHLFDRGHSLSSYGRFLGKRIARVYPLYLFGTLCAFVLILLGILEAPHMDLRLALIWNLLMVQSWGITGSLDGPGWSISTEWAAYLLYPAFLLFLVRNRAGRWIAIAASLAVLVFLSMSPVARAHAVDGAAVLDVHDCRYALPVLRCLAEFVLGMIAYQFSTTPSGARFSSRAWIQDALALAAIALLMIPRTDLLMVCSIPPLLAGLARGASFVARVLSSKPMELAGRYSYSIYLIHTLLYGMLGWIHHQVNAAGLKHGQTVAALVGISVIIPLAALAYHLIEKPGRAFIRNLIDERPQAALTPLPSPHLSPVSAGLESQD